MNIEGVERAAEEAGCVLHILRDRQGHYTVTIFKKTGGGGVREQPLATFYTLQHAYDFLRS